MSVRNSRVYTAPIPKLPPGLVDLMEGLAKDVIKCNPTDVYTFCANHMKKLLEIRDGSSPTHITTLEQKISMANKKVRERAAKRREAFDKQMQQILNQRCEKNIITTDQNNMQYNKDNVVKIPERDLCGNAEHEIITEIETPVSSESVKLRDVEMTPPIATLSDMSSLKQESIITILEHFPQYEIKYDDDNAIIEKSNRREIENDRVQQKIEIFSETPDTNDKLLSSSKASHEKNLESVDCVETIKSRDNSSNQHYIATVIGNEDYIECEKSNMQDNIQQKEDTVINNNNATSVVTDYTDLDTSTENEVSNGISKQETSNNLNDVHETSTSAEEKNFQKEQSSLSHLSHAITTSMDLETAAITIQKVFRSFLFRNKTLSTDDATNVDINVMMENQEKKDDAISGTDVTKDRRALCLSRIDSVLQTVNEEKSLSLSTDSSTLSSAATIIQAHVRGFLVRNKFNVNKNSSTTSGIDSDGISYTSIEGDNDGRKNKTVLNIHIVPESGPFMSRDESLLTSIDLSLDGSPPCSTNLHLLGYDTTERRKQLKREDAIQSISPPSNNSGKLSEDVDSVKEVMVNNENSNFILIENNDVNQHAIQSYITLTDEKESGISAINDIEDQENMNISVNIDHFDTALEVRSLGAIDSPVKYLTERPQSLPKITSDEMDVITPFTPSDEKIPDDFVNSSNLIHSGEFHEVVLPTKVSRSDTSVVRGE